MQEVGNHLLPGPRISVLTLAAAPVGGVSVVTGDAALAVSAGRQVFALLAHALVDAPAVAVTLTSCQRGTKAKVSVGSSTLGRIYLQNRRSCC